MNETHPDILQRIQAAKEQGLTDLNLSNSNLISLPEELGQLTNLATLNLSFNNLTHLPEELGQLTNLTSLDLSKNRLTSLPEGLGQLTNLTSLDLSKNRLTSLPEGLGQLTNLTSLDLCSNKVSSLPEGFGRLIHLTSLNLRNTKLTSLPERLGHLIHLTSLDLSGNRLTSLPEGLGHLINLTSLDLSGNNLTSLPEGLGHLIHLTSLDLSNNRLSNLPEGLGQLTNLTSLSLRYNNLISLPERLGQLTNLASLNLRYNNLTSLPEWLGQLTNLTSLDLSKNRLTSLPEGLGQLTNLTSLDLHHNPIEIPPPEVLDLGWDVQATLKKIRNYFRQLREEGVEHLYEAKLLIIGEAGAGKTSLAKKIVEPANPLDPDESSTEGITVGQWAFNLPNDQLFRVNIWDFGGQEIYHATHQFFLTKRSLYALVADMRREDTDFNYWLNVAALYSNNSPLIIIKNEKQDRHFEINEPQLRGQFSHFKDTLATNLQTNRGLEPIRDSIRHYISHLPHVGDALPKTWVNVRQALESDLRDYISLETYLGICQQNGFKQMEDKLQLSDYLHDLGICLHFQNDSLLRQTVILKPQWGTDAVYRVLDNEQVSKNFGRFSQADLDSIWGEEKYAFKQAELLRLMINFQLCYEIPDSPGQYIAPQLLTKIQPAYDWEEKDNLILRYTYEFMPKGILTRLTVIMHRFIADQAQVWRSGVVLAKDNTLAEVVEDYGKREIKIRVAGKHKRDLLTIITHELDKIHASFNNLKFKKLIPCNCSECKGSQNPHFYDYEDLRTRLAKGRTEVECYKSYQMVKVVGLIDDVGSRERLEGSSLEWERELQRGKLESLKEQQLQHHRNLGALEEQAAKFGSVEKPLHLLNQINDEKHQIAELEGELRELGG